MMATFAISTDAQPSVSGKSGGAATDSWNVSSRNSVSLSSTIPCSPSPAARIAGSRHSPAGTGGETSERSVTTR